MRSKYALFKIGGKILENEVNLKNSISQLYNLYDTNVLDKIIVVPGGGTFANFVRSLDLKLNLGDEKSHWMAIHAMDFNGQKLATRYKQIEIIEEIEDINKKRRVFAIFLPFKYLKNNDFLPHNWQVTSDSIALYLAHELNFECVYLIKDVDGLIRKDYSCIKEISTMEFKTLKKSNQLLKMDNNKLNKKFSTPIDDYLPDLIDEYKLPCVILNGAEPARITNFLLKNNDVCSTQLIPTDLDR
ncbi:MAG: amino acid kinase family protein [Promethearchaeota archaeon]